MVRGLIRTLPHAISSSPFSLAMALPSHMQSHLRRRSSSLMESIRTLKKSLTGRSVHSFVAGLLIAIGE